jgi:hypothetical protein
MLGQKIQAPIGIFFIVVTSFENRGPARALHSQRLGFQYTRRLWFLSQCPMCM